MKQGFVRAMPLCIALFLSACQHMPQWPLAPLQPAQAQDGDARTAQAPQPAPGPVLHCRVSRGSARFRDKWTNFRTADFTVAKNARAPFALHAVRGDSRTDMQAWFDGAGQRLIFCPVVEGPPEKKISCASIYALDEDLEAGIKRTLDIPKAIQGGVISCAYDIGRLRE